MPWTNYFHDGAHWLAQVRGIESRYCRAIGSTRAQFLVAHDQILVAHDQILVAHDHSAVASHHILVAH